MTTEDLKRTRLLDKLYREQFTKLFLYARAALQDPNLGEEAVQDTFRIACDKAEQLIASESPPGWLMNTLKHVISNMERSRSSLYSYLQNAVEYNDDIFDGKSEESNIDLLYHGFVSDVDFELLKRIVIDKYTYLEAANLLGISLEACKKRVQRIKNELRKKLR